MDYNLIIGILIVTIMSGIVLYAAANPPKELIARSNVVLRSLIK